MSGSAHMAFRDLFVSRIAAPPAIVDGGVKAGKRRPMPEAVKAQIYVDLDDSPAIPVTVSNGIEWSTKIRVRVMARDHDDERCDVLADRYLTQAYGRVMADPYFAGAALQTDPSGLAWQVEDEADSGVSECVAVFMVRHRCPRSSVAAA